MPDLLARVMPDNEAWFTKLPPSKTRFRGTLFPVNPTALPTSVFILPRVALRTRPAEPVKPRDLVRDPAGRVLLVGAHDATLSGNTRISRVYALFQMTRFVSWKRRATETDPITLQETTAAEPTEHGPIWVSVESYTRGDTDAGIRVTTDRLRLITGAAIQLGDVVDGKTVKRINQTLGIFVAEFE